MTCTHGQYPARPHRASPSPTRPGPLALRVTGRLREHGGLADPRLSGQQQEMAAPGDGLVHDAAQLAEHVIPADRACPATPRPATSRPGGSPPGHHAITVLRRPQQVTAERDNAARRGAAPGAVTSAT
jgi:hypothetical protein